MSRTITAMFDDRSEAEAARQRLAQSGIDADRVRILAQDEQQQDSAGASSSSSSSGGFWSSLKDVFMPDEDRSAYGEGVRRGGCLVCAEVDEDRADEAVRILDESGSVDFDQREQQWRSEGWTGGSERSEQNLVGEERIPIVEEELRVGKREVERGGARVRSFVRETPVSEQVNLREEHVSIERRPVDRPVSSEALDGDDLLRDREVEMTERSEEAVVDKEARVREEVVVRKEASERTERIEDTVRHTEVDVDRIGEGGSSAARPAFGFEGNDSANERSDERPAYERGDVSRR